MIGRVLDNDRIRSTSDIGKIRATLAAKTPIWIELEKQSPEADAVLTDMLHLHPLTIEDIWGVRSAPKLEDYDNYLYVKEISALITALLPSAHGSDLFILNLVP